MSKRSVEVFTPVRTSPTDANLRLLGPVVFVGLPHTGKWPFAKAVAEYFGVPAYKIANNLEDDAKLKAEQSLSRKLANGEICAASMVFGASYATTDTTAFIVAVAAPLAARASRRAQNKKIPLNIAAEDMEDVDNTFREAIRPAKSPGKILHRTAFHMPFATNGETGAKLTDRFMKEFKDAYKKWLLEQGTKETAKAVAKKNSTQKPAAEMLAA